MEDKEILEKLNPLPGQLVIIERGDCVGLRGAIMDIMGEPNINTLSYYVDGVCIGTEIEGQPAAKIADKLIEALEKTTHPVKAISVDGDEETELSQEGYLQELKQWRHTYVDS